MDRYPWLRNSWQQLIYLYRTATLPHALLLIGVQGIGKTVLLKAWEKLLLCSVPTHQNTNQVIKACGQCRACMLYQNEAHPDRYHYGKETGSIAIDEIREVLEALSQKAHQSGRRLVTLWGVDQLPLGSANALLKMVEEPPNDTFFILVAQKNEGVLATIKSRCITLDIPAPSLDEALAWLKSIQPCEYSEAALEKGLRVAGFAPLKAKMLLDSNLFALNNALYSLSSEEFYDKACQQFITTYPKEAVYFLYYELADKIRFSPASPKIFDFLDTLTEGIKTLSLPGINKNLLFESLFWRCRGLFLSHENMVCQS